MRDLGAWGDAVGDGHAPQLTEGYQPAPRQRRKMRKSSPLAMVSGMVFIVVGFGCMGIVEFGPGRLSEACFAGMVAFGTKLMLV